MAKAKFNVKEFLLRRGEVLVMGVAGFSWSSCSCGAQQVGQPDGPRQGVQGIKTSTVNPQPDRRQYKARGSARTHAA